MDLEYATKEQRFFTPPSLDALFDTLEAHPDARLINGGTDLSLLITKQHQEMPCLVSLEGIPELHRLAVVDDHLHIGATVRLTDLEPATKERWPAIERMLRFFGARQIKNRATVSGSLCNASPIGDMAPVLVALGATVHCASTRGARALLIDDFLVGYRQTALEPGEIVTHVVVPPVPENARVGAYKVSKRQELDISIVSAGYYVELDDNKGSPIEVTAGLQFSLPYELWLTAGGGAKILEERERQDKPV